MSAQRMFYGTLSDLQPGLSRIEAMLSIRYILAGAWAVPTLLEYESHKTIPELGISKTGDTLERHYLIMPRGMKAKTKKRAQKRGSIPYLYFVDADDHPNVLTFFPGGVFRDIVLTSGSVGTGYNTRPAKHLYKIFARELTRGFTKIDVYRVGPEACRLLHNGWRLTPSVRWATEANLRITASSTDKVEDDP